MFCCYKIIGIALSVQHKKLQCSKMVIAAFVNHVHCERLRQEFLLVLHLNNSCVFRRVIDYFQRLIFSGTADIYTQNAKNYAF